MKILLFLADGFEEIEAIAPIDVFRRAEIEVLTISVTDTLAVEGAHGISVLADYCLNELDTENILEDALLFLPGGMPGTSNLDQSTELKSLITKANNNKQFIAAICAAPSILGKMGILKSKKAICYPGFEQFLEGADVATTETIVEADNILTSKAPGTAIPFALRIVEILKNKEVADRVKSDMFY